MTPVVDSHILVRASAYLSTAITESGVPLAIISKSFPFSFLVFSLCSSSLLHDCAQGIESISSRAVPENGALHQVPRPHLQPGCHGSGYSRWNLVDMWDLSYQVGVSSGGLPTPFRVASVSTATLRALNCTAIILNCSLVIKVGAR